MSTAPISLYFDIDEHEHADLEVVARTALAFNSLVKEVIHVLDPSLEVHVEFVSGTPGSASIDNIVKAFSRVAKAHPLVVGPLVAIATAFLMAPIGHLGDDAAASFLESLGHKHVISDEDANKIAAAVVAMQRNQVAVGHKQELYRQARREPKIKAIGVTEVPGLRPTYLVKQSDFVAMSGAVAIVEETPDKKTEWKLDYPVIIVRAVMKSEARTWRFAHGADEFSAVMKDKDFLAAIKTGHTGVEIGEGVEIRIDLKVKLERHDGIWTEKERTVEKVILSAGGGQGSLGF